jgi:hydrogenase expression/formation protein HypE
MDDKQNVSIQGMVCPVPLQHNEKIVLGHGGGGKMTHDLIKKKFLPLFDNSALRDSNDAAIVKFNDMDLAISTDAHVVWPLFFTGGDIGRLAVCGTVNDVTMMGADPLYLSASFILEEGLDIDVLERVIESMHDAATEANVNIIAGDTKVVQKGKADGLYITTTGVGVRHPGLEIGGALAKPGDIVILSGTIGDHGIAVLEARGELGFTSGVQSDTAPLNHLVKAMLQAGNLSWGNAIHVLRDPTRGGLATTLNEIAHQSHCCIVLDEDKIPVNPQVAAACEMLGFDPLYIANEGKLVALVDSSKRDDIYMAMRNHRYGTNSEIIGKVIASPRDRVLINTSVGGTRVLDMLASELLPRIC